MEISKLVVMLLILGDTQGIFKVPGTERPLLTEYDFVIVGSGSSGSVLANRLSKISDWKILLVEAGKRPGIINDIPVMSQALQSTDYNWNYRMEKTPGACLGSEGQRCVWPRGKGLGGTTLINYMIYNRGNKRDYDKWSRHNPGWSYDDVLPYFKKSEKSTVRIQDEGYHNTHGPLNVEDVDFRNVIVESFIAGGKQLGYPTIDYNGRSQKGFGYVQANTKRGVRHSAYRAFIQPVEYRNNLHVSLNSRASKILIDKNTKKAYGLEFIKNRKYHKVNVTKEVIISAGVLNSPQILMLSGIGPKEHLESFGIEVVEDLRGVGRNLQDHITFLGLIYTVNVSVTEGPLPVEDPRSFVQWYLTGTGPWTDIGGVSGIGFINTNVTVTDVPDVELIFMSGKNTRDRGEVFKKSFGFDDEIYDRLWRPLEGREFWSTLPMLLHPKSIGRMELKSKDPFRWPKFHGNYLSDAENSDVKTFIAAIREIQRLAKTEPFRRYGTELHDVTLPACEKHSFDTDDYWECALRQVAVTLHHQIGTCKMGPKGDAMAVVDNSCRVHGIRNLRVADTSVIPNSLSAHTSAPAFMIGEKISDAIREDWERN